MNSQELKKNDITSFFFDDIKSRDSAVAEALALEKNRQQTQIELIASENIVSKAVLQAQGSVLTNKYAEGLPGKRYYGGCDFVDVVENLAIERAKKLFDCAYANVQPHSGAQANQAVMLALLQPGDGILGMGLDAGGHLSHGSPVNLSGKWFKAFSYGVQADTGLLDMDEVASLAKKHKPRLIIAGGSAYARTIDFASFRAIADSVGAYLMVDMAHFAGLVAAGIVPSPLPHAHVVTTTTHKTLRGPRGGLILSKETALSKKINSAVFPGLQGGPLMHVIAAKAVAFQEALAPSFKVYAKAVVDNAQALGKALIAGGLSIITDGTDTHLVLADMRPKHVSGKDAEELLESVNITCNKNCIPFDAAPPTITSGLRLGTPAATTRGFGVGEFTAIGQWISTALDHAHRGNDGVVKLLPDARKDLLQKVHDLCARFPIYQN